MRRRGIEFIVILDLHVSNVGGEVQKNILSILLLALASVGEQYCLVSPERLVASQELQIQNSLKNFITGAQSFIQSYVIKGKAEISFNQLCLNSFRIVNLRKSI